MANKGTIFIEISKKQVTVVCSVQRWGHRSIVAAEIIDRVDESTKSLVDILAQLRSKPWFRRPKEVVYVVPLSQAIIKYFHYPIMERAELKRVLELQLSERFPYAWEDVSIGMSVSVDTANGKTGIVAFCIPHENILPGIEACKSAKIRIDQLNVSALGLICEGSKGHIVFYVGDDTCQAVAWNKGRMVAARSIALGNFADPTQFAMEWEREIIQTFTIFQRSVFVDPISNASVIASGEIKEFLKSTLSLKFSVSCNDKASLEGYLEELTILKDKENKAALIPLLGLARKGQKDLEFLTSILSKRQTSIMTWQSFFKRSRSFIVLVSICMMGLLGIFMKSAWKINGMENEIRQLEKAANPIELQRKKIHLMLNFLNQRMSTGAILKSLSKDMPSGIVLTHLEISAPGTLVLEGISAQSEDIADLQKSLKSSGLCRDVFLENMNKRRNLSEEFVAFRITGQLSATKASGE